MNQKGSQKLGAFYFALMYGGYSSTGTGAVFR
jgi:hypothetical protein